jgi:hypothetical protein
MPNPFYDEGAALALELLTEFGEDATIQPRLATPTLQGDGSVAGTPQAAMPCKAMELVAGTRMGLANAGSVAVEGGTKRFSASHILSALPADPEPGMTFTFKGVVMTVRDARTVNPAGTRICHFIDAGAP